MKQTFSRFFLRKKKMKEKVSTFTISIEFFSARFFTDPIKYTLIDSELNLLLMFSFKRVVLLYSGV